MIIDGSYCELLFRKKSPFSHTVHTTPTQIIGYILLLPWVNMRLPCLNDIFTIDLR
jgi:hypothetical protein